MTFRPKKVTATSQVLAALRAADDFLNQGKLREILPACSANEISAALYNLRKAHAVDVVVNPDGEGWWFALPEGEDRRVRAIAEIVEGIKRPRKPKARKI